MQVTIETDQKHLQAIQAQLESPAGEHSQVEAQFRLLDTHLVEKKKELQKLRGSDKADALASLEEEVRELEDQRRLARDAFNLAVYEPRCFRKRQWPCGSRSARTSRPWPA